MSDDKKVTIDIDAEQEDPCPPAIRELILEDTTWKSAPSSRPNRGLHDYERTISFKRDLTEWELGCVREWLRSDKCPGYTEVHAQHTTGFLTRETCWSYKFTTTWDSSD